MREVKVTWVINFSEKFYGYLSAVRFVKLKIVIILKLYINSLITADDPSGI